LAAGFIGAPCPGVPLRYTPGYFMLPRWGGWRSATTKAGMLNFLSPGRATVIALRSIPACVRYATKAGMKRRMTDAICGLLMHSFLFIGMYRAFRPI